MGQRVNQSTKKIRKRGWLSLVVMYDARQKLIDESCLISLDSDGMALPLPALLRLALMI